LGGGSWNLSRRKEGRRSTLLTKEGKEGAPWCRPVEGGGKKKNEASISRGEGKDAHPRSVDFERGNGNVFCRRGSN